MQKRYFIAIFFLLLVALQVFMQQYKDKTRAEYLSKKTSSIYLEYKAKYDKHKDIIDLLYKIEINKPEIIRLFKNRDRHNLYETLKANYKELRTLGIRQLHFHLPNNESFLRMHRPSKFGDDLSKARATVKYVNEKLKPIDGFEEGKIFNGFRFVYPLFDGGIHIGSVEISLSALAFIKDFIEHYEVKSHFLIDKAVVDSKVFKDEKSNYIQSLMSQYYSQKSIVEYTGSGLSSLEITKEQMADTYNSIQKAKPFSRMYRNTNEVVTYIPLQHPISSEVVATFVFRSSDTFLISNQTYLEMIFLISIVVIGIILILLYRELKYKAKLERNVRKKTQEITKYAQLLDNVIKGSNLGYWDWYPQTKEHFVNDRWLEMLGLNRKDITNTEADWYDRVHPEDIKLIMPIIEDSIEKNVPYQVEFRMKHQNGSYIWIQGSGSIIEKDSSNKPLRLNGTHIDITKAKLAEAELLRQRVVLEYQANHDALTGLKNRLTINKNIEKLISEYKLYKAPYALLMLDIDFFKSVNDEYGHDVGDLVLIRFSELLKSHVREEDKIYRVGGEEFMILLKRISYEDTAKIARKIREQIQKYTFKVSMNQEFSRTVSCGLYHSSLRDVNDVKNLLKLVDIALYKSKENGRNTITDVAP